MRTFLSKNLIKSVSALTALLLVSCSSTIPNVSLDGGQNAGDLKHHVNGRVCISGVVNNDDLGIYMLLAPFEDEDGVIQPSPPRIQIMPMRSNRSLLSLTNGRSHRVCGILRDITPSQMCERDDCRWYELKEADLG